MFANILGSDFALDKLQRALVSFSSFSLCYLCVLCVSAVDLIRHSPRRHREHKDAQRKAAARVGIGLLAGV